MGSCAGSKPKKPTTEPEKPSDEKKSASPQKQQQKQSEQQALINHDEENDHTQLHGDNGKISQQILAKNQSIQEPEVNYEYYQQEDYGAIRTEIEQSVLAPYISSAKQVEEMSRILESQFSRNATASVVEKPRLNNGSEKRFKDLQNLLQLIESNVQQADLIRGQDIVIILGATGVGKSTSINYLLGKKLQWSKIKNQTKSYVYEVESITVAKGEQEAAKIGTKPMESQTKSISVYKLTQNKEGRSLLLCDTPGLLDSQGSIVDIANQVGIVKSLHQARSVKVLLLIGYKNLVSVEGKGKLMKEVIQLYSKLIRDFASCEDSVLVGFTHLNNDTKSEAISNSLKAMTEDSDEADQDTEVKKTQQFLEVVIKNLDAKSKKCQLVKPLVSDLRQALIDSLFGINAIPQDKVMENFSYALAQNTKNDFELILMATVKDIANLFAREDFSLVTERLHVLKRLKEELDFVFVERTYNESIVSVLQPDLIKNTLIQIQRLPTDSVENLPQLIDNIIHAANYLAWTDSIREQHTIVQERLTSFNEFVEVLAAALEATYANIENTESFRVMSDDFTRLQAIYFCKDIETALKKNTLKLQHSKVYTSNKLKNIYDQNFYKLACKSAHDRISAIVEKLQAANDDIDAVELEKMLSSLKEVHDHNLGKHVQLDSGKLYEECVRRWRKLIAQKLSCFEINFNDFETLAKGIDNMRTSYEFIIRLNSHQRLIDEHFKDIAAVLRDLTARIIRECNGLIKAIVQKKKLREIMKPFFCVMELMKMSEEVRMKLSDSPQTLFAHLGAIIQKLDTKFSSCVQMIKMRFQPRFEEINRVDKKKKGQMVVADITKSLNVSSNQDFDEIEKNILSMKKIFEKLSSPDFSSIDLFSSCKAKCQSTLSQFFAFTAQTTKAQIDGNAMLNGLYTLKQCAIVYLKTISKESGFSVENFNEILSVISSQLTQKVTPLLGSLQRIQIPRQVDESYNNVEELLREIDIITEIIKRFKDEIVPENLQEIHQQLDRLLDQISQSNIAFNSRLNAEVRQNIFDFSNVNAKNLPTDNTALKLILDQYKKLTHYVCVYSRLIQDAYESVLRVAIETQQQQIDLVQNYIADRQVPPGFTHESALRVVSLIRSAGILYQTHFSGKLENLVDHLQDEVQLKQKGLDKNAKQLLKEGDFEAIVQYLKNAGEGSESYKSMRKILKEKVVALYESIEKNLIDVTFGDDATTNKLKEQYFTLGNAASVLSDAMFKDFSPANYFASAKTKLHEFLVARTQKFRQNTAENTELPKKIEKASRRMKVINAAVENLAQYLTNQADLNLPVVLMKDMRSFLARAEATVDVTKKQEACQIMQVIKKLQPPCQEYHEAYESLKQSVTAKVLEQAHIHANSRVEESETVSIDGIAKELKREFEYMLPYVAPDANDEQIRAFFQPVLNMIMSQMTEVDAQFREKNIAGILKLINQSKSTIVFKQIAYRFSGTCDTLLQAVRAGNFETAAQLFRFLSVIVDGIKSSTYEDLKIRFANVCNNLKADFQQTQKSAVEAVSMLLSDQGVAASLPAFVTYCSYSTLIGEFPSVSHPSQHEPFYAKSADIFETVQTQLTNAVNALDARNFCSSVKLIDSFEQTKVSFGGKQMNLIELYNTVVIGSQFGAGGAQRSTLASFERMKKVIQSGSWTIDKIKRELLASKVRQIHESMNKSLADKNYHEAAMQLKKYEDFSKRIVETQITSDTKEIAASVTKRHLDVTREANARRAQGIFDAKLFQMIEDIAAMEKDFQAFSLTGNTSAAEKIVRDIEAHIDTLAEEIIADRSELDSEQEVKDFVASLTNIRKIGFEIGQVHEFVIPTLGRVLQNKFQQFSPQVISDVSGKLRQDRLGLLIIQENGQSFEGLLNKMIEEVSKNQFSLEYVNRNTKGDNFNIPEFSDQYGTYETTWKNLLSQWHQGVVKATDILTKTKILFKKFTAAYSSQYLKTQVITWNQSQKRDLAIMLAHLSAYWSVVNCQRKEDTFRKLHPVQVSTVMRLLSIDTTTSSVALANHLVQVKTGEGKSIVLGLTSSFLALLGFYVDCCCYSSYLSQRDFTSFTPIFDQLEISSSIKYSTFEKQFEDIINDPQDMRKMGLDLINNQLRRSAMQSSTYGEKKRILLIDEVDFFFGEDFIGRTYPVALYYNNQDVIDILKYIWQNRSMHIDSFRQTEVYKKLFISNPNLKAFQAFIDERIKMMYEDVNNLEGHRYLTYTPSGKSKTIICYKSLDGISFNTVKGYKTAFAYIQEWEKKNITEDVMNENLSIIINVGCFSFAQIPQQYALVLGVSGTLEDMNEYQKQITKDLFNIRKLTISPSIYGQSKFSFRPETDVLVKENRAAFHAEISAQIEQTMKAKRAVIVFFESKKALDTFKEEFKRKLEFQVLSEETNFKGHTIVKAGSVGMITLATRPFGRGCDFISTDPELDKNGGIHIIQTFLSEDLAEETQIKGRTARQSQRGSYGIVMNLEDLVKNFQLPADARRFTYDQLHSVRQHVQKEKEKTLQSKLKDTLASHQESMRLKQILLNFQPDLRQEVLDLLLKFNKIADRTENKTNLYNFYSDFAGKIGIFEHGFEYDEHKNPINAGLGSDGSFNDQSILIGLFYAEEGLDTDINQLLIPVLRQKGFKMCDVVYKESDFIAKISGYDQVWVVSGYKFNSPGYERKFQDAIENHLRQLKGLMIWADNNPYIVHSNIILQRIPVGYYNKQPIHIKLDGSDYGDQVLKAGNYFEAGQFAPHLITTGINNLHEGITICYPQVISNTPKDNFGHLNIIGLSSASKPCFFVLSGTEERGRIVFDCGFTKLMQDQWNTAGTVTYVTNCYAWLYWKERMVNNM